LRSFPATSTFSANILAGIAAGKAIERTNIRRKGTNKFFKKNCFSMHSKMIKKIVYRRYKL